MAGLAIPNVSELVFGVAPRPVRCGLDLSIGSGTVFTEVNFTLPMIDISRETWREIVAHYEGSRSCAGQWRCACPGSCCSSSCCRR
jgi:hypothetical protein